MKQYEAVMKVMEERGGYSTLGNLYVEVMKIPGVNWRTKTPFASIRRIVQDSRFFFKIRPGLWALERSRGKIPKSIMAQSRRASRENPSHSYYQGLLVELGNLRSYQTFVPNQDRNRKFLDKPLAELTTVPRIYPFSYDHLVRRAQTIDVIWFNDRNMPEKFFEVEHSTDIQNSLMKYLDLQDFRADIWIVADRIREREYQHRMSQSAFKPLVSTARFLTYEALSELHAKEVALSLVRKAL